MIRLQDLLKQASEVLLSENPRLDAEILLAFVLSKSRSYLYTYPEKILPQEQCDQYQFLIQERSRGVPIAYLTGIREFWSMPLKVNNSTLIPRPETEKLVEITLELITLEKANIIDLGTGSGAIALALAKERPHWTITAVDKSQGALDVAQENAQLLAINNINFICSDWFNQIGSKKFHAIISNPPYIAENDPHLKVGDLRFEPQDALISGQDGTIALEYLVQNSIKYLLPSGILLLEHGYDQREQLQSIMLQNGYQFIQSWQDDQGVDRVTKGVYIPEIIQNASFCAT